MTALLQRSACPWVPSRRARSCVRCNAQASPKGRTQSRTDRLRQLLKQPGILQGPCCHDGLSARLIERAGYPYAFMSGFCTAGARLGAPDTGLISYAEMVDTGRNANEATRTLPIIGDGDTGYGNAMNVKRTVRGYAQAGFAGILIEDQVAPKSCGHVKGKRVVSREEAVMRIKAAVDARNEGADILIVARTDARQAVSMDEALWRVQAFAEAGADVLFIDALESEQEMRQFCWAGGAAARVPKMASMLEGGKTPILSPRELQDMGFKLVAYPLSLLGASIRAMEDALGSLKQGVVPGPEKIGTFADIQAAVGFPEYYQEQERYAVSAASDGTAYPTSGQSTASSSSSGGSSTASAPHPGTSATPPSPPATPPPASGSPSASASTSSSSSSSSTTAPSASSAPNPSRAAEAPFTAATVVEPDVIEEPTPLALTPTTRSKSQEADEEEARHSRYFLIKITERSTGVVKLQTRIPSNFISSVSAIIPAVNGINLESVVERALREKTKETGGPLVSLDVGAGDLLQVFLEY